MCLAVPCEIRSIENEMALVEAEGVTRKVSLLLLDDAKVGEFVIVHAGFAINRLDPDEARESLKLLRQMALAEVIEST
ncbi:MAG: HypC/HybG/HupF family hydrogenase formation chaperone [Deltaproteobacteria bacterium]|nr:HypC/HybG/HupF family hydrogenase formation chaperone [Deltaproteobacteria bacterium]